MQAEVDNHPPYDWAKNVADLKSGSLFFSSYRGMSEAIPHTPNNWVCYDFKERRVVPTHYAIRTNRATAGAWHLKSWLVETSVDGESWLEVAREENSHRLNGEYYTAIFPVRLKDIRFLNSLGAGTCRENQVKLPKCLDIFSRSEP
jgi:hypothetical protein